MKLVIGGYAQGKLNTVLQNMQQDYVVFDGEIPGDEQLSEIKDDTSIILNHFHCWIRACLKEGENPEERVKALFNERKDFIIISDEIGNGIVPVEAFEREYRECAGRILIELAARADEVVRVICGIQQTIK